MYCLTCVVAVRYHGGKPVVRIGDQSALEDRAHRDHLEVASLDGGDVTSWLDPLGYELNPDDLVIPPGFTRRLGG